MSGSRARPRRNGPFCWQEHRAVELVHARWAGRERTTALAIYGALTYLASIRHRDGGRDGFPATRGEIAEKAGSKPATVDAYARGLQELGLLAVERRRDATGRDVASLWVLGTPTATGGTEEEPAPLPPGVPGEEHRGVPDRHPFPKRHTGGSPSAPEDAPPTRARRTANQETRELRPSPSSVAGRAGARDGTGEGQGEGDLDHLTERVWAILAEALDWLGPNDHGRPWPKPNRETIRQALTQHQSPPSLARNVALDTKRTVQEQDRAPNIAGLYRKKLAAAEAERPKVRELIRESIGSPGEAA